MSLFLKAGLRRTTLVHCLALNAGKVNRRSDKLLENLLHQFPVVQWRQLLH